MHRMCALALAALLAARGALAATVADSDQKSAEVERTLVPLDGSAPESLAARMAHYHVPGVSIAVIERGRIAWAKGYGVLSPRDPTPVDGDTLFQAASISKPIAATAALELVGQGRLDPDRDVNAYLKSWQVPPNNFTAGQPVTLRLLVSHHAGLTVPGFLGYETGEPLPTIEQILDGALPANSPPVRVGWRPGSRYEYSGGGFTVLQLLLADTSGEDFSELAERMVLRPLGMSHSGFFQPLPPELSLNAAWGHDEHGEPLKGHWHVFPELAAAGLWSTPSDLARFELALQSAWLGQGGNDGLTINVARSLLTRQGDGRAGHGIFVAGEGSTLHFYQAGDNVGYKDLLVGYADGRGGAVVMTNGEAGQPLLAEIVNRLALLYGWPEFQHVRAE